VSVETGGANLRAIVSDGSTNWTIILGTMTTALQIYQYELLFRSGDAVDLQYNGITGPMEINMKVLQSDDIQLYV